MEETVVTALCKLASSWKQLKRAADRCEKRFRTADRSVKRLQNKQLLTYGRQCPSSRKLKQLLSTKKQAADKWDDADDLLSDNNFEPVCDRLTSSVGFSSDFIKEAARCAFDQSILIESENADTVRAAYELPKLTHALNSLPYDSLPWAITSIVSRDFHESGRLRSSDGLSRDPSGGMNRSIAYMQSVLSSRAVFRSPVQRTTLDLLIKYEGRLPIKDLAGEPTVKWDIGDYDNAARSLVRRMQKVFSSPFGIRKDGNEMVITVNGKSVRNG